MGIRHLAAAMYEHRDLNPTAKLLLVCIADHINDETGWGWPSATRLAALCGINERNTRKWIDHLEKTGHIEVRRRDGWANHYRLTPVASDTPVSTDTPVASDTRTRRTRNNQQPRHLKAVDNPTTTPPPVADVLAQQETYR